MSEPSQSDTNALENAAAKIRAPGDQGTSTKDILKGLNRTFYKINNTIPNDDPRFISIVLLDTEAARLKTKSNHINTADMMQSVGGISMTLPKMQATKETFAFHEQYTASANPMINDAQQRLLEKEELERSITQYIEDLHGKLAVMIGEIKQGKPMSEIQNELADLDKQEKALAQKSEKLGVTISALQKKLESMYHEMFTLLPATAKAGLRAPATMNEKAATPSPER
ncbi:MAG: hypothetical protein KIT56_01210 [Gammaproteobacteria bacterium]|nr:hypothetical protein [Gammaproteobacteria bacterium]MCW5582503.1 hypothetical protein [Gammaproteobacteria bacterium]